ncbi:MAG: DUF2384 domain-containing protein [Burkholderiales bacterium]|nr:DUF2384 domain-containing protein [Burkholderiales bacterium]
MALATIRRILLELGHEPQPEDAGAAIGQLERWMHEPRPELDGLSALAALQTANGEVRLRKVLNRPGNRGGQLV